MDPHHVLAAADQAIIETMVEVAIAAKRLKKCPATIRRYIRSGHLRAVRASPIGSSSRGGNYLIPESALREFLVTSRHILIQPPL